MFLPSAVATLAAGLAATSPQPHLTTYEGVSISPDGERIVALEKQLPQDSGAPEPHGRIVVRSSSSGAVLATYDPCPKCRYGTPSWGNRTRSLAVVGTDPDSQTGTLYVLGADAPRALVTLKGTLQEPRWSPDDRELAVLAVPGARKEQGPRLPGARAVGVIGKETDEQRIATIPSSGGELSYLSPADTYVYEYHWLPAGGGFVATVAKGDGDSNWWVANLVVVESSGATRTLVTPTFQITQPVGSPDGRTVLFIGGLMSDFTVVGGDLYSVPTAGGAHTNLTQDAPFTVNSLTWSAPDPLVTMQRAEHLDIARVDLGAGGRLVRVWSGMVSAAARDGRISVSRDGLRVASMLERFDRPPAIWSGHISGVGRRRLEWKAVSDENSALASVASFQSVSWSNEGFQLQGWLLRPNIEGAGLQPMIVRAHGGPSSLAYPKYVWNGQIRRLLERGYNVFEPNFRGSFGQGQQFTLANRRDFGRGDLRDILAGVEAVQRVAPIDNRRVGIMGHSYGGFMTMAAVAQTDRFRAAVAGAGVANWTSYYGQNGIEQWMIPFFGASAYDDPDIYWATSPLAGIKKAKTPTLLYVGEFDVETPAAQSLEFWRGLRAMGVPTELVIYEGEGHVLRKPEYIHDVERRTVEWFDRHLSP